jgi:2,3-bisphosphoglycerate-independent phosphoglycerate mutase
MKQKVPCMLMILDGWGINSKKEGNAVKQANMPVLDALLAECPHTELQCSGEEVGLPHGIMGNSEVGHLNIGAGRIVYQDLLRIDMAIKDKSIFENKAFNSVMKSVKEKDAALHLMGLVSDGGVHSTLTHLFALIDMAEEKGVSTYVHAILDGRDTPPESGADYLKTLTDYIETKKNTRIASVCGRYYAMDRDTRWDRVEKAYKLYTEGEGTLHDDAVSAVRSAYKRGETDEFVTPILISQPDNIPDGTVKDNDGIIFFNFRADRAREITTAFTQKEFDSFKRNVCPVLSEFVCMTEYDEKFTLPVAFDSEHLDDILGEVLSRENFTQLRIAETEKYAHVTYFFNGGEEEPFPGEDRCLVPSPREINTYDEKPEMSAFIVKDEVIKRLDSDKYDFIVLNFANMDMVGHTGIIDAAIQAVETVDTCVGEIVDKIKSKSGTILITADHGNSEKMLDENGNPHTAHTTNKVPLLLVNYDKPDAALKPGKLGDIAPTILHIMGIEKPELMTGVSLIDD